MSIRIDVKSLVTGLVIGGVVFLAMGQAPSGAGKADFAIAVENGRLAVVRASDGIVYSVDPRTARAETVVHRDGPAKGLALNLNRVIAREERPASK